MEILLKKDGKKVVDLFNQKTSTTPIQKEEAFEIKYLNKTSQRQSSMFRNYLLTILVF